MDKSWLDTDLIRTHSLDMRQFMGFRESTLANGMRIIDVYNSSGLTFTILPDRGMDIWSAHYKGMPLTWIAPASPHLPDFGRSWLELFNGGLLTTCGLTHVGPPEDKRDIHGNYTRLRATDLKTEQHAQVIRLTGSIYQSSLFGEQLLLKRTYELTLTKPRIHIYDEVQNIGDEPVPFMMLYHCNLGYPMVRAGTELITASEVYPRDAVAQAGLSNWQTYESATIGYAEQVFFHHSKMLTGHRDFATVALMNKDIGLEFSWDTKTMPYLTQWKNTRQGIYVCGIEPGNCIPEGQNSAREAGRLCVLKPQEKQQFELFIEILDGEDDINRSQNNIKHLREHGEPINNCELPIYNNI